MDMIEIKNERLTAVFSTHGAELQSLRDQNGVERIWQGDPAFWTGHAPVLFPVAGALRGDAYTLDGGLPGGIEFENFNAASAEIDIVGNNTHPGGAKDKMVNAALLAVEFASMLPATEIPACTSGFEGFYHLMRIEAKEESAHLVYIIRDHNKDIFESRKVFVAKCAEYMNRKYGEGVVTAKIEDQYANMRTVLEDKMYVVDRAREAYRAVGVEPYSVAIRGGTDGATLSYMGLPCPNIATGGMNAHGRRELAFVQDMDKMVEMLKHLIAAK